MKVLATYYEVLGNRDQTEGKGGYDVKRTYLDEYRAVGWAESDEGHRELGVMGHGPAGEVVRVDIEDHGTLDGQVSIRRTKVWGYRKDWTNRFNYGYIDLRDAPTADPEYDEYVRLKTKFEGRH